MMTKEKLRECPFCGGEAIIVRETSRPAPELHKINSTEYAASPRPSVNDGWLAECKQCGARGPHEYTMPVQSMDKAATAWNTRPLESAMEARVKELEAENAEAKKEIFRLEKVADWLAEKAAQWMAQAYADSPNAGLDDATAFLDQAERIVKAGEMPFYGQPNYAEKVDRFNEIFPPLKEGEK